MVQFFEKFLKKKFFTPKTGRFGGEKSFLKKSSFIWTIWTSGPSVEKTTTYGGPDKHQKYDYLDIWTINPYGVPIGLKRTKVVKTHYPTPDNTQVWEREDN